MRSLVLAALLLVASCKKQAAPAEEHEKKEPGVVTLTPEQRTALALATEKAIEAELPESDLRTGLVSLPPSQEAVISAPVSARTRTPVTITVGSAIAEGDVIAELIPVLTPGEQVTLSVQAADLTGQLASAKADVASKKSLWERGKQLAASGLTSPQDLELLETGYTSAKAKLAALETETLIQRARGGVVTFKSPVKGIVAAIDAPFGATLAAGHVLARIVMDGPRWVDVAMPADAPVGTSFSVKSAENTWVPAKLLARGLVAGVDGLRRDRLEVTAPGLVIGASIDVRVARGSAKGIVIPASAVVPTAEGDVVYVESEPNHFVERTLKIAARLDDRVRVASGVALGDSVVTIGAQSLRGERMHGALGE
ncbi:MAG: efflux RND transporter periplasmic adaptor subunit [Polyangiales bacterium]